MTDELLIRVENVSKRFCRSLRRSLWYGVQDLASEFGDIRYKDCRGFPNSSSDVQLRPSEFWAVKDVSFELRRGECLGLIGRNGAGKTTLLRMLNGLIKPDTGSIQINGSVGSIIALGAGFNPSLTGRENIRVAASVLGLTRRRTNDVIDEVIEFSELGEFIDSPVQSYSSGMQIRLGFSVTTALDPDILILDEVLAVGDVAFRTKCFNHMATRFRDCATIFVSHNMPQISRVSTKAAYMKGGSLQLWNQDVNAGIFRYHEDAKAEISKMCVDSDSTQILHLSLVGQGKHRTGQSDVLGERVIQLDFNYDARLCDKAVKIKFASKSSDRVMPLVVFSDQEMTNVLQISPAALSAPSTSEPNFFVVPFDSSVFSGGYYWISVTIICCATGSLRANYRYALQFVSQSQPMYAPIYFQ